MSEHKHRPGPWILSEYEVQHPITLELRKGCEIFCNKNNKVIAEIPDYCFHPEDVEQDQSDARLITAAPELLADLVEAAATLRRYEALHRAKATAESTEKAEVNAGLATRFEATIKKAGGQP